jgi:hypothetical protein
MNSSLKRLVTLAGTLSVATAAGLVGPAQIAWAADLPSSLAGPVSPMFVDGDPVAPMDPGDWFCQQNRPGGRTIFDLFGSAGREYARRLRCGDPGADQNLSVQPPSSYNTDLEGSQGDAHSPLAGASYTLTAEGHADLDSGGSDDLYLPADTSDSHNNLTLGRAGLAELALVNGRTTQQGCTDALNSSSTVLINLSDPPADTSFPQGGPGSWVCVRTNENNLAQLTIDEVHQASQADTGWQQDNGQKVVVTVTDVWPGQ